VTAAATSGARRGRVKGVLGVQTPPPPPPEKFAKIRHSTR